MTDLEITKTLSIPSSTLSDWKNNKSNRNSLYSFLSKITLEEALEIDGREILKENTPIFSENAKAVKLNKKWFYTDLLWSSGDGQRIGVERLITIYMSNPDQRNSDVLIDLFGAKRVENVVNKHFDFDDNSKRVKPIALKQVRYGRKPIYRNLDNIKNFSKINILKLSKSLKNASQERIDKIISKVDENIVLEAARKNRFPESFIIEDKIKYAVGKII